MRINAGKYRNHNINMCNLETTRETSDKVRQAIFNLIGQFFDGGVALDLFAGSGAMGLEAYSRGINKVYFNDINNEALKVVKDNCNKLKCSDDMKFYNCDYKECLNILKDIKFDLIFLDPPYKMVNIDEIVLMISNYDMLANDGYLCFEMQSDTNCSEKIGKYILIKDRKYGIKKVCIFKREQ
ncbi:MAG: 16S rRNA (guanine(966)-N(2))-methyltransferase RsmD [Anaeroplasmataceae bacterium]